METKTEIIAVGSELLLGQIANTNAQFLSAKLAELGVNVYYHTVVGDNQERLLQAIQTAEKRANIIIFTGGLGPTKDDLTKETLAKALGTELVTDDDAMQYIEDYYERTKRTMSENNKKQALVLQGSKVLKNEYGMAPGMALKKNETIYMMFPGPPSELQPMFTNHGRKYLLEALGEQDKIISRVLRFFGIGESQLETEIDDLIDNQSNPTIAPLAGDGEVTLRLTAKHSEETTAIQLLNETESKIRERAGEYLYGYDQSTIMQELVNVLIKEERTIASAESLTGGLFAEQMTAVKGTSAVLKGGIVCYASEVKEKQLKVKKETLEKDGAVSDQCAKELAENVREIMDSEIGIGFTGEAGPEPMEDKPVGTVYIGIALKGKETKTFLLNLAGSRDSIRKRSVKYGCYYLMKLLNEKS
ncbi:competence/damage-inducible protein A [Metabacillus sp. GX 13764]|uniref:competence/damage-inducible protein A n=1 Tax=Metabacillus kandeliae TaxID=2900151 RepID=UPI001E3F7FB8|nr:competence/damage-inducible protein A [Metabacillus kandeliae]MCD7033705.1 competence/damage-inducible protein A [Metabacillus kandeliae]